VHMVRLEADERVRAVAPLAEQDDDANGNGSNGADASEESDE